MAISFTSNGAVPGFGIPSQNMSGTSQAVGGANTSTLGQLATARNNYATSGLPSPAANALNAAVAPSTPVKSQTTTSPDGTVNSVTYHPPATSASNSSSSGTSSGVLSKAPTQPLAQATIPQSDPTTNPYTGTTANNPMMGSGYANGGTPTYNGTPNSQFQSSSNAVQPMNTMPATPSTGTPTFGAIVGNLANTSSNGSNTSTQATNGLLQAPNQNGLLSQAAANIGNNYGQQIAQASNYGQGLVGGELTSGAISPIAQGTAGISQGITSAKVQGLTSAENAALAPINQELTAQSQAQSGLEGAGTNANTQQANEQSGLQQAGALSQPSATSAGQTVFNPTTGTFTGNSLGTSTTAPAGYTQDAWNQIVSNVANGNTSAISGLPTALQAQAQADAAAKNPGFNINTAEGQATGQQATAAAPGSAAASNITSSGTAATNSWNGIYSTANTQAATTATQQAQIRAVGGQALGLMQSDPAINKFAAQFGNQALNKLQSQLSNPQYAAFNTAIQSLQSRIGAALQAGEIPTAATSNAEAIANGNISLNALGSTLSQVDTELSSFVDTQNSLASYAKQQAQSGTSNSSNTQSNASSNPTGWF